MCAVTFLIIVGYKGNIIRVLQIIIHSSPLLIQTHLHVLKSRVHLDDLNKLHENFVLVPADKASNNVIVVCKKYYLDVVIKELSLNNTYKEVHNNNVNIISRHLDYKNYDEE